MTKTITVAYDGKFAEMQVGSDLTLTLLGYVDSKAKQLVVPVNDTTVNVYDYDYTKPIDINAGFERPLYSFRVAKATNGDRQLEFFAAVEAEDFDKVAQLLYNNTGVNLLAIR